MNLVVVVISTGIRRFARKSSLDSLSDLHLFDISAPDLRSLEQWLSKRVVLSERGSREDIYMRDLDQWKKLGLGFQTKFGLKLILENASNCYLNHQKCKVDEELK